MGRPIDEIPSEVFYELRWRTEDGWWFRDSTQRMHPATESELQDVLAKMRRDRAAMRPPFRPKYNIVAVRLDRHEIYQGEVVSHPDSKEQT
jgi:hypothetical protein